ncbi:TetR/AcrR family transcriptional regulator [Phytoactinopolyspora alkaliphila]|uniref:TetR/AcrR family transcriptional regulator n=1 Tax=Phytoactinopolyspora alkaliphila TaxID=1783498 RepID=A0A6N9YHU4_9ACTN|nr:TetR family transcriptional regulator [Phytoactinopolyspora alkaliphila]NED94573.1 TetR/AcrR family transcriptional regulator [Phytoactinopolyspora alkaliphila]
MTRARRSRAGRRPGGASTRDDVLVAARAEFEERGYEGATVRAIAARANVDPAMIHHFFGNKENLFLVAMQINLDPAVITDAIRSSPRDEIGERAVRTFLAVWGDPKVRGPLLALLRSAMTHGAAAALLRQFVTRVLLSRIVVVFGDAPDAALRAEAMVSQLIGMAVLRFVVQVEPLASASEEEIVALIGPVIQQYVPPS